MIFYNAGYQYPLPIRSITEYCLHSYYYKKEYSKEITDYTKLVDCIIDSGAWSAWQKNITINIDDYMTWLSDNKIQTYITLDVIGNTKQTLTNYKIMLDAGFNPCPVYQLDMPTSIIGDVFIPNNPKMICIGGVAGKLGQRPLLGSGEINIIDKVFAMYKQTKFHILGNNSPTLWRWPVYSCDSTALLHVRISAVKHLIKNNSIVSYNTLGIKKEDMIRQMLSAYHVFNYMSEQHTLYWQHKGVNHWQNYKIKYNHHEIGVVNEASLF